MGITEGFVYKNVGVHLIIIATIATVVRNVLQEPLHTIAADYVQKNITDGFVLRNVIVHRINIAIQSTAVYKNIKVYMYIKHAHLILVYINMEKKRQLLFKK